MPNGQRLSKALGLPARAKVSCIQGIWAEHMGKAYGQGIWAGHMNRTYGQSIWAVHMGRVYWLAREGREEWGMAWPSQGYT